MKLFLSCMLSLFFIESYGQGTPFDTYKVSRIRLQRDWKAKKIVAYKVNSVTILVDYKDYKKEIYPFWRLYKRMSKDVKNDAKNGEKGSVDIMRRYLVIDSIYRHMKKEIKQNDTVFLAQSTFDNIGLRCLMDMDKQLEQGTCAVIDENHRRRHLIVRKKGSWYRGPLHAWGGRRYYLPEQEIYFFQATDWIS